MADTESIEECPVCGEGSLAEVENRGRVCQDCGLVHNEEGWSESLGREIVSENPNNDSETEEWQDGITIRDATDKQLVGMLSQIESAAQDLRLTPEVRNHAADILIEAWMGNLMHGRDIGGVLSACLYLSSRELEQPRPLESVATVCGSTESRLQNGYRALVENLELDHDPPDANQYLSFIGEELGMSEESMREANDLLSGEEIVGNPAGVAAAALYVTARDEQNITLCDAGDAVGVTKETIWRQATELR